MSIQDQLQHSIKTIFSQPSDASKIREEEWKDIFQALKDKLAQSKAIHKKEVDWEGIASESTHYLSHGAKDIRVASYLCYAWAELYSVAGLNAGVNLLAELTAVPDKQLYPHRNRARAQQFEAVFYFCLQFMRRDNSVDTSSTPLAVEMLEKALQSNMPKEVLTSTAIKHIEKIKQLGGLTLSIPVKETPARINENTREASEAPTNLPENINEWLAPWLAPISSTEPAGSHVIDTDDYGIIKQHINNRHRVAAVNWQQLLDDCQSLLCHSSKDLQIACYAVYALAKIEAVRGTYKGLQLLKGLLENFGNQLFPRESKRRVRAITWLADKLDEYLSRVSLDQLIVTDLEQLIGLVESVNGQIEKIIPQNNPQPENLYLLISRINKLIAKLNHVNQNKQHVNNGVRNDLQDNFHNNVENKTSVDTHAESGKREKKAVENKATTATAGYRTDEVDQIETDNEFRQYINSQKKSIRLATDYLRKNTLDDPRAYKMLRLFYWASLSESGFSRKMRPPSEALKKTLLNNKKERQWAELLNNVENAFDKNFFWLDLNYWSSTALAKLGYREAANVILLETQGLIVRFPTILEGEFTGGMAFASDETTLWLRQSPLDEHSPLDEQSPLNKQTVIDTPSLPKESSEPIQGQTIKIELTHRDDDVESLQASVQQYIKQQQPTLAVDLLENAIAAASSGRERFLYQTLLAQLFLNIGLYEASLSCLEYLDAEIKRHNIEFWEKNLSIRVASLICELIPHIENNKPLQQRGKMLQERAYQYVSCLYPRELLKQLHSNTEPLEEITNDN